MNFCKLTQRYLFLNHCLSTLDLAFIKGGLCRHNFATSKHKKEEPFGNLYKSESEGISRPPGFYVSNHDTDGEHEGEEDSDEGVLVTRHRNHPFWHLSEMKRLSKVNVKDAIRHFEETLLKKEKLPKLEENLFLYQQLYHLVIRNCAIIGFAEKAFFHYNTFCEDYRMPISNRLVTSLFNACANCKDKEFALKNARKLYKKVTSLSDSKNEPPQGKIVMRKPFLLNDLNYSIIIKAFSLLGDYRLAFQAFKDLKSLNPRSIRSDSFSHLLMACIENKKRGFYLALKVFKEMKSCNVNPTLIHFNLLLRSIRDCSFGCAQNMLRLSAPLEPDFITLLDNESDEAMEDRKALISVSANNFLSNPLKALVNINKSNDIDIGRLEKDYFNALATPNGRFEFLGGFKGLKDALNRFRVKPDIKLLSLVTEILPNQQVLSITNSLVHFANINNITLDTIFFNMLIKKVTYFQKPEEKEDVKPILFVMSANHVTPDIKTFGILSISDFTTSRAMQILKYIDDYGGVPNIVIYTTFVNNAYKCDDIDYLRAILTEMEARSDHLNVTKDFLQSVENLVSKFIIYETYWDKRECKKIPSHLANEDTFVNFRQFSRFYQNWLSLAKVVPKDD